MCPHVATATYVFTTSHILRNPYLPQNPDLPQSFYYVHKSVNISRFGSCDSVTVTYQDI